MSEGRPIGQYITELVVVFVGVALAFAVENLREDLNEREVGEEYLEGFAQDLRLDLAMLEQEQSSRQIQLANGHLLLELIDEPDASPAAFFGAYYGSLGARAIAPNRNTMDEVLNSGNLRLIRNSDVRAALLELYASYEKITFLEAHIARDFENYLYDPTFSTVRLNLTGPWPDNAENRLAMDTLRNNLIIQNGLRLLVGNVAYPGTGLLAMLEDAQSQVVALLQSLSEE